MIEKLKAQIETDEGRVNEVYLCSAAKHTFGVGHMILATDPEYQQPPGTPVSRERVAEAFDKDIRNTIEDCRRLYEGFDGFPEEVQLILGNMMFNLGQTRLRGFSAMRAAILAGDYATAADEMLDSKWHKQLPRRSTRLHDRMLALA